MSISHHETYSIMTPMTNKTVVLIAKINTFPYIPIGDHNRIHPDWSMPETILSIPEIGKIVFFYCMRLGGTCHFIFYPSNYRWFDTCKLISIQLYNISANKNNASSSSCSNTNNNTIYQIQQECKAESPPSLLVSSIQYGKLCALGPIRISLSWSEPKDTKRFILNWTEDLYNNISFNRDYAIAHHPHGIFTLRKIRDGNILYLSCYFNPNESLLWRHIMMSICIYPQNIRIGQYYNDRGWGLKYGIPLDILRPCKSHIIINFRSIRNY